MGEDWTTVGDFEVAEGQQVPFVLTWHPSHLPPPPPIEAAAAVETTLEFWRDWAAQCTYEGRVARGRHPLAHHAQGPDLRADRRHRRRRRRPRCRSTSAAARNWDYRYCWLRDATFTLAALIQSGYIEEAAAWRDWLLRAVAGRGAELQIMYGVAGERRLPELELPWLPGYESSRPVRIGNGAYRQFQLDVYGEVIDSLHLARRYGLDPSPHAWRVERELMACLEDVWREPDEGIWEVRGPRRHFTHSKVMAWVAFDRAVQDVETLRSGRTGRAVAEPARRAPRRDLRRAASTPNATPSCSPTAATNSTPRC